MMIVVASCRKVEVMMIVMAVMGIVKKDNSDDHDLYIIVTTDGDYDNLYHQAWLALPLDPVPQ